jgi:hypothetical protein
VQDLNEQRFQQIEIAYLLSAGSGLVVSYYVTR